jgi:hypothetical protein
MVLSWLGGAKTENVEELIARKKYAQAVELLLRRFKDGDRDPRLRLQLADVLVLSGKGSQAVPILTGLADEYARDGYAAKAIAVLKKIQRVEPGRKDVAEKLAQLIEKKIDEGASVSVAFRMPASSPQPESGLELGMEEIDIASPAVSSEAPEVGAAAPEPIPEPGPAETAVPMVEAEPAPPAVEPTTASSQDDLLTELEGELARPAPAQNAGGGAVASPLFSDFEREELLAVINGLELRSYDPGDIVITHGEPGDSLFILTTGVAKAFIKEPDGRHKKVREMEEGSFFGEISVLTGSARTATVTAATTCELLVLDRATLDSISTTHPKVRTVLQQFADQRSAGR